MTESILDSTKESLGVAVDDTSFDSEIRMHINGALGVLRQNGIGRSILIADNSVTWDDFKDPLQVHGNQIFNVVPQYVFVYVKILYDPPAASQLSAYKELRDELIWRLTLEYDKDANDVDGVVESPQYVTHEELIASIAEASEIQDPKLDEFIRKEAGE